MRLRHVVSIALMLGAAPLAAVAAPSVELQNLKWIVLTELPSDLGFYQVQIDAAMLDAIRLLQGDQGPADVPCCAELRQIAIQEQSAASLVTIDGEADFDTMTQLCQNAGGGSCAFLVSSITWCGGPGAGIVGCADTPLCNQNLPNDDPTLVLAVSLAALEEGMFAQTLAHERGHNACLEHVPSASNPSANLCNLMQAQAGGGCINATECNRFRDAGNAEQGSCACHTDALTTVADGASCNQPNAACSGGVCGAAPPARVIAAGGPGAASGAVTDEVLRLSALAGGWSDVGDFGVEVRGMEYARSRARLYAVTAADELIAVDPDTGARLDTIGALPATGSFDFPAGLSQQARYESLAFDPGNLPTQADDLLYSIRVSEGCGAAQFCVAELVTIDPDDAATVVRGPLTSLYPGTRHHGLAYDVGNGKLFGTLPSAGLVAIDTSCAGTPMCFGCCEVTDDMVSDFVFRDASLAYDLASNDLVLVGGDSSGGVSFVTGGVTTAFSEPIGIDAFTPGALAAPEPGAGTLGAGALVALWISAAWRRSLRRPRRAARRSC
jgi:hypothetical protein